MDRGGPGAARAVAASGSHMNVGDRVRLGGRLGIDLRGRVGRVVAVTRAAVPAQYRVQLPDGLVVTVGADCAAPAAPAASQAVVDAREVWMRGTLAGLRACPSDERAWRMAELARRLGD